MSEQFATQRLLSSTEILGVIPISRPTLHRLVKAGKLRSLRVGRRVFFRRGDLEMFLRSCSAGIETRE